MTSPVKRALFAAELEQAEQTARAISIAVARQIGPPPDPGHGNLPAEFAAWCEHRGVETVPARPASVALFVLEPSGRNRKRLPPSENFRQFNNQERLKQVAMKSTPPALSEDRVRGFRAEIDSFIDAKVKEIKKTCPGVPEPVLRNVLMSRTDGCLCAAYLNIVREEGAVK
jgi:hypothetical protein